MATVHGPTGDCPKCGSDGGWKGPEFHCRESALGGRWREWLEFRCINCGYAHETPCADHVDESWSREDPEN